MSLSRILLVGILAIVAVYALSAAIMVASPYLALIIVFTAFAWIIDYRAEKKKNSGK
jgi:hypothetical protein